MRRGSALGLTGVLAAVAVLALAPAWHDGMGASLAVAAALMQGIVRNPLADPARPGLMAGASFAVVLGTARGGPRRCCRHAPRARSRGGAGHLGHRAAAPGGATPLSPVLAGSVVAVSSFRRR